MTVSSTAKVGGEEWLDDLKEDEFKVVPAPY